MPLREIGDPQDGQVHRRVHGYFPGGNSGREIRRRRIPGPRPADRCHRMAIRSADDEELEPEDFARAGPHRPNRPAKDASTNEIVAWTLSETIGMPFVIGMLRKLDSVGWLPRTFLLHSDQGCHYTSYEYRKHLSGRGICQSMSRRGNCWDNAPVESFFGHAKDELRLRRCPGLRRRGLGDRRLHRLLQQLEASGRPGEDDARGVQGLSPGKAHPPPRPPRGGERKREPLARGSRFSIGPGFLNVSLTWGPHYSYGFSFSVYAGVYRYTYRYIDRYP